MMIVVSASFAVLEEVVEMVVVVIVEVSEGSVAEAVAVVVVVFKGATSLAGATRAIAVL